MRNECASYICGLLERDMVWSGPCLMREGGLRSRPCMLWFAWITSHDELRVRTFRCTCRSLAVPGDPSVVVDLGMVSAAMSSLKSALQLFQSQYLSVQHLPLIELTQVLKHLQLIKVERNHLSPRRYRIRAFGVLNPFRCAVAPW